MTFNILIAGVGGQGTVLASRLIASAAMKRGLNVRTTETIGMAQRGGSVIGHTRVGDDVFSPLIPVGAAHVLLAFEPAEAVRNLHYLAGDGTLIVCDSVIKPITVAMSGEKYEAETMTDYLKTAVARTIIIDGQKIKEQCGKTLNVALLGVVAQSGAFPFDSDALVETIEGMSHYREQNLISFELGRKLYDEHARQP